MVTHARFVFSQGQEHAALRDFLYDDPLSTVNILSVMCVHVNEQA